MQGGDDGDTALREPAEECEGLQLRGNVEMVRWFVKQQKARVLCKSTSQEHPLPFTTRKRGDVAMCETLHVHGAKGTVHDLSVTGRLFGERSKVGDASERDDVGDGEGEFRGGILLDESNRSRTFAARHRWQLVAVEADNTIRCWKHDGEGMQERGLSGAIGSDERGDGSRRG